MHLTRALCLPFIVMIALASGDHVGPQGRQASPGHKIVQRPRLFAVQASIPAGHRLASSCRTR